MVKLIVCLYTISVVFTNCEKQADKDDTKEFSLLNGNSYILKVDRVSINPAVQFPHDTLHESDYVVTNEEIKHNVIFSEDGQKVTIEPGSVSGEKAGERRFY